MHVSYRIALVLLGLFLCFSIYLLIVTLSVYRSADRTIDSSADKDEKITVDLTEDIDQVARDNDSPDAEQRYQDLFKRT